VDLGGAMVLSAEIQALRERALADLGSAHDYYTDTKAAWGIVHEYVGAGNTFLIENTTTGTVTTHTDLASRARGYVAGQLAEATFQQFISIFEAFFFDFLRLWLLAYPRNLIGKKVDFKTVLNAPDKDAITMQVVDKEFNDVMYERPAGWFAYLEERAKLGSTTPDEVERVAEAKASRDILVHNRGIASKTYESKAGKFARFQEGQRIDVPEDYHRRTWELVRKVVTDLSDAAASKVA
jgi:hypothetical protein